MIAVGNGFPVQANKVKVSSSIDDITRSFFLEVVESKPSLLVGSPVKIMTASGTIVFSGEVEYISNQQHGVWKYSGRSGSKLFADGIVEKTTHFSKGKTLNSFLATLATKSKISIKGKFDLPKKQTKCVYAGEKIVDILRWLVKEFGVIFISDALGNIELLTLPQPPLPTVLSRSLNVSAGTLIANSVPAYTKCTVISQGLAELGMPRQCHIQGSYGAGIKETTFVSKSCLTIMECVKRAQLEVDRCRRNSYVYKLETTVPIEIGKVYPINDILVGVNEPMLCVATEQFFSDDGNIGIKGTFTRI